MLTGKLSDILRATYPAVPLELRRNEAEIPILAILHTSSRARQYPCRPEHPTESAE